MEADALAQWGVFGGAAGAALGIFSRLITLAIELWRGRPDPVAIACQSDPVHFERIRRVDERVQRVDATISRWDDGVQGGAFGCSFRDRDEVRDLLELIREQVKDQRRLIDLLAQRDGGHA